MEFFKKAAKTVGKGAANFATDAMKEMQRKRERVDRWKERLESNSDEELRRKFRTSNNVEEKMAINEIMKERGY